MMNKQGRQNQLRIMSFLDWNNKYNFFPTRCRICTIPTTTPSSVRGSASGECAEHSYQPKKSSPTTTNPTSISPPTPTASTGPNPAAPSPKSKNPSSTNTNINSHPIAPKISTMNTTKRENNRAPKSSRTQSKRTSTAMPPSATPRNPTSNRAPCPTTKPTFRHP